MTSISKRDLEDYGAARVRDIAFDAVRKLWRQRREEGVSQKDLADALGRDPSWISRQLSGPGNWTFRSFGALVEALDGEVEIFVHPIEEPVFGSNNFDAYDSHLWKVNDAEPSLENVKKPEYKGGLTDKFKGVAISDVEIYNIKQRFSKDLEDSFHG